MTRLAHDRQVRNKAAAYGDSSGTGTVFDLVILAGLAPYKARWEFVTIEWRDNGTPRTTLLRFNASDFPSFEKELRARTGLEFEDMNAQRDARLKEIESHRSEAVTLRLDRATTIRNELVKGGSYQVLVIERQPSAGDLYLFHGKEIKPEKPSWVVPVTLKPASEAQTAAAQYVRRGKFKDLDTIQLPGRTVIVRR